MKQQIILSEYSDEILIPYYELSQDEREYLTKTSIIHESKPWERRFYFDELKRGLRIKTQSWVGVIELDHARIVIQPKFNNGFTSLIEMISFIEDLPFYQWKDTSGTINKTYFLEILVQIFLKEIDRVLKIGLVKEYVNESDNLTNLRGRVDFRENVKANYNLPTRVYCNYDELVTNVVENQILLSVLTKISSFQLQPKTKQQLNMIRSQMELVCEEFNETHWPTLHYNRLNTHYERAHKIGYYLWRSFSATSFFKGKNFYYSFLVDMNELFEKFVLQLLTKYLPHGYKVSGGKRITDSITVDGKSYRHIIPDIIIEHNNEINVLDVKYKQYGKRKVETSDIFQLAFYSQYFNSENPTTYSCKIIYPRYFNEEIQYNKRISLNKNSSYPGELDLHSISIEEVLGAVKSKKVEYLKEQAFLIVN